MKKNILKFVTSLLLISAPLVAGAQTFTQKQLIITPFYGVVMSTTTKNGGFLEASTSPTFLSFNATSTTATSTANRFGVTGVFSTPVICLTGDTCRTTWPTGGSGGAGTVGTSTPENSGYIPFATTNSATPALLGFDIGFFWDNVLKRHGIGTTTPWGELSVNPNGIGSGIPEFVVGSSTATHFVIDGGGKVGINTATPSNRLHVALGNNEIAQLNDSSNASAICGINGCIVGQSSQMQMFAQGTNPLVFLNGGTRNSLTAGTENMRINFGGYVGIGTSSPTSQLNVASSSVNTTLTTYQTQANLSLTNSNTTVNNFSPIDFRTIDSAGTDITTSMITGIHTVHTAAAASGDLAFHTLNAGVFSEKARIMSNGRVGIGTTTPGGYLSINPNGIGSNVPLLLIGSSTRPVVDISAAGVTTFRPFANGANIFNVSAAGSGAAVFQVDTNSGLIGSNILEAMLNQGLKIYGNTQNNGSGASVTIGNDPNNQKNPTSGVSQAALVTDKQGASTGTGEYNLLEVQGNITQTGTASGIIRGIYLNPTLTTNIDYRAIETKGYTLNLNQSTTTLRSTMLNQFIIASTTATTVTNAYQAQIMGAPKASTNVTISTSTALIIEAGAVNGGGTVTTSWGAQIFAQTGASTNNALGVYGKVYMPNVTTASALQTGDACFDANGQVTNDSVLCVASSKRFKTNIEPLAVGLDEILKFRPVAFNWKNDYMGKNILNPNKSGTHYSLIAEEVQKIDPNLVEVDTEPITFEGKTSNIGDAHGLTDLNNWVGLFAQGFQDLNKKVEALKAQGVPVKRAMEENWQDILIALLVAGFIYQQFQIKNLKK